MLRTWLTDQQSEKGVLATINDPRLSRALQHIHGSPELEIDLNTLAQVAGMSRTSFAVRFREVMGTPPASYLAEWRMLQARRLLLQTDLTIADIVTRVGYGSDAAFLRAFKRRFGETPGKLRRNQIVASARALV
jgi:AraC-like DNA-binding protein